MKYKSALDKDFRPLILEIDEFLAKADKDITITIEDADGYNYVKPFKIDTKDFEKSYRLAERIVKTLFWAVGGYKIIITGSEEIAARLKKDYSKNGARAFDSDFMAKVYGREIEIVTSAAAPKENSKSIKAGGFTDGCRIGFDAGGSDRKVSAVIDGEVIYSEEVVWFPKINEDPDYHFDGIVSALKTAASKMPRVDAIGVSSAGIYINDRTAVASLFLKVPEEKYDKVRDIYIRAAKEIGNDIPLTVANDGDVTAIAGNISFNKTSLLGIAMGTSEAGGYVNSEGGINGWLNELAFVPCDFNPGAAEDEWSGDIGTGVNYFSQDAVIKLAKAASLEMDGTLPPAEKLKIVQKLAEKDDKTALEIFDTIGAYLGYTIPYYNYIYGIKSVLVLGRVLSGKGGQRIIGAAKKVLKDEFKNLDIEIITPDEKFIRVGQSIAAASLPKIG